MAYKFPCYSRGILPCCWQLFGVVFYPLYPLRVETDDDVIFYGKEGIVYGNVRLELAMSQSTCVDLRCVRTRTKMWWLVSVGVIYNVWLGSVAELRVKQCLNEWYKVSWCIWRECRIFFLNCHVVKLWRVLHCFQEECLNSLSFVFPLVSTPLLAFSAASRPSIHWVANRDSKTTNTVDPFKIQVTVLEWCRIINVNCKSNFHLIMSAGWHGN